MTHALQRLSLAARYLAALTAGLTAAVASAQTTLPSLKLEFLQPTGQVSSTASISVQMRLTNTDASQAFSFNSVTGVAGMSSAQLPTTAWSWNAALSSYEEVAFASYSGFDVGVGFTCSGTFYGPGCSQGAYLFTFGSPGIASGFQLAAGQSHDYTYGVLNPIGGSAPAGTYTLYNAPLFLNVLGKAADGRSLTALVTLSDTCTTQITTCTALGQTFTRTVTAVPEPASAALMVLGLLGMGAFAKRRRCRA